MGKTKLQPDKLSILLAKHGVATVEELVRVLGNRMQIKRKVEEGLIHPLGSGIYASPSLDPFSASVVAASRYFPKAVVSGLTALAIHKLSDESISKIDVDIPRGTSIRNHLLNVHRVSEHLMIGQTEMKLQGYAIRVYDAERALCDAFKLDPDGPIFFKALKRRIAQGKIDTDLVAKYDQELGTEVLARLRQELAVA